MSTYDYQASGGSNSVASPRPGGSGGATYDDSNSAATPGPSEPGYNYDINSVNPMNDLQYLSFLRGYGVDSNNAHAQTAYQRSVLNQQLQTQIPQYEQQRTNQLTDVGNSAAASGSGRSSAYLSSQNRVNEGVDNSEVNLRNSVNGQIGQNDLNLQTQLSSLDEQKAEQELNSRINMLGSINQNTAYQRAMIELGYSPYGY